MKKIITLTFLSCMFIFSLIFCGQKMDEQKVGKAELQLERIAIAEVVERIEEKAAPETYLSDLEPLSSIGSYLKDINQEKHLIFVQGSKYEKGLCVSSPSELTYNLDRRYAYFKCIIGHHDDYPEYEGLLVFSVFVDDKNVYESRPMGAADSEEVNVTVKDTNHLTLTVKDNGISTSYVVWADAKVF